MATITYTEFNAHWKRITDRYWTLVNRAESCWNTRDARFRREGASRRYRVELARLRAACGCAGCAPKR